MAKKKLTKEQEMKIDNIAGFKLLTLIAEDSGCANLARLDSESVAKIFLAGCQAGVRATEMYLNDELGDLL